LVFRVSESEKKVRRKAPRISFELLVQTLDRNTVELSQIRVKNDLLITQNQNLRSNSLGENDCSRIHDFTNKLEVAICDLKRARREQGIIASPTQRETIEHDFLKRLCRNGKFQVGQR